MNSLFQSCKQAPPHFDCVYCDNYSGYGFVSILQAGPASFRPLRATPPRTSPACFNPASRPRLISTGVLLV